MPRPLLLAVAVCLLGTDPVSASLGTTKEVAWRAEATRLLEARRLEPAPVRQAASPRSSHPWKRHIMTTVFWIGEDAARNNPVPNDKSWFFVKFRGFSCC